MLFRSLEISLIQLPHTVRRPNQSDNNGILFIFIRSYETNSNVAGSASFGWVKKQLANGSRCFYIVELLCFFSLCQLVPKNNKLMHLDLELTLLQKQMYYMI